MSEHSLMQNVGSRFSDVEIAILAPTKGHTVGRQIDVVGAVILNEGRILCAQRGPVGSLAGMWEFPGGKIERGESAQQALEREILEELGCTIAVRELINTASYGYDFGTVNLTTFYCELVSGQPNATEHSALEWRSPSELDDLEWAPADLPAVEQIKADLA